MKSNYKDCLITIPKEVIEEELSKGTDSKLVRLTSTLPKSNRVKYTALPGWGNGENIYMKVKNSNLVLMHVKDGGCVIVPEYVTDCSGSFKSVVATISPMYYTLNGKNNVVASYKWIKNKKLYRQIMALKHYGDIKVKIPQAFDVHHKFMRWLSTEESMKLVLKENHMMIEDGYKSHRYGFYIGSIERLEEFLENIIELNQYLADKKNLI